AVGAGDLGAGAVAVLAHDDAHVQPHVAVDQVVAAPAFDQVAAVAAQDDVAGPEGNGLQADELVQPGDQREVDQHAAGGAGGGDAGGVQFVADQHVGE